MKRFSAEDRASLVKDYICGLGASALAAKYDCHRGTVHSIIKAAGVKQRGGSPSSELVGRMVKLYEEGETLSSVGESVGYSANTVKHHLLKQGVSMRQQGRRSRG